MWFPKYPVCVWPFVSSNATTSTSDFTISLETVFAISAHVFPVDSVLSLLMYIVLAQLSEGGSRKTTPANTITLNGFTFSTSVACGWFIQSISS